MRNIEFLLGVDCGEMTLKLTGRDTIARTWPTNTLIIERSPLNDTVVLREDINGGFFTCIYTSFLPKILSRAKICRVRLRFTTQST